MFHTSPIIAAEDDAVFSSSPNLNGNYTMSDFCTIYTGVMVLLLLFQRLLQRQQYRQQLFLARRIMMEHMQQK